MKEEKIWEGVALIRDTLKSSEEYILCERMRKELANYPEKIRKINEFREAKFRMQNGMSDGMHNTMEELFERQQELRKDELCRLYLESEAKLCNIIRKATEQIMDVVDLEILQEENGESADGC